MKGSVLLAETLKREGVKVIFGIPGLSNMAFYDALVEYVANNDIRVIIMRHEQGAAHAADGYARASGKPGFCTATSGPGALNLVTGLATAYWDSSPVIAITGQVTRSSLGKLSFQEADIPGVVANITKFAIQIRKAEDIPIWVRNAIYIATTGRPGPVVIDIPRDLFNEDVDSDRIKWYNGFSFKGYREFPEFIDPIMVKKAAKLLIEAEKPLMIVGAGAVWSPASEEIIALAEMLRMPIVSTLLGKSAIPNDHPLYIGMMGYYGRAEANKAFMEADVVLVVGARLSDRTIPNIKDVLDTKKKLILINIDPTDVQRLSVQLPVESFIISDVRKGLKELIKAVHEIGLKSDRSAWIRKILEYKEYYSQIYYYDDGRGLKPWKILKTIRNTIPRDAIITTGVGAHQMWAGVFWESFEPRTFLTSGGMGTMGFGLPAAMGAKVARPDKVVVDLDGDGSFIMTMNNLGTAVDEDIPIIAIVFDNRTLGLVRQVQDLFFNRRIIAVDLGPSTNFVKIAEGFGALGFDAQSYEDIEVALRKSMKENVPAVIRVPVNRDEKALPTLPPGGSFREMIVYDPREGS
ncbi:acetolactate synthase large subunit [Ignisphaera sp. 4213-co]|uniref:Acetolactate synthase n=2 Tax=Ignisphaera cupida TaxID=3050454 RepID=A0ABD4Z6Z2_9CREN|nr:acetolactate synthase large subunit [Ignisphaera sp. 4213-co]MDK6028368.1 acetolactate synthase large subunit [Ignisphaera sp. 4213-co]